MPNVLIVGESDDSQVTLNQYLLRLGLTVSTVETGEKAFRLMRGRPFDFVLTPLCLLDNSGRGVARWVKQNLADKTRVFIMTSWKGELELDMLRLDGIQGVIKKPFSFREIRDTFQERDD